MAGGKFRTETVLVWALVLGLVSAQLTFSRDWVGGKRAPAPLDCGQFARLCRQFVHELKSSLAEPAPPRRPGSGDPPTYDEE